MRVHVRISRSQKVRERACHCSSREAVTPALDEATA